MRRAFDLRRIVRVGLLDVDVDVDVELGRLLADIERASRESGSASSTSFASRVASPGSPNSSETRASAISSAGDEVGFAAAAGAGAGFATAGVVRWWTPGAAFSTMSAERAGLAAGFAGGSSMSSSRMSSSSSSESLAPTPPPCAVGSVSRMLGVVVSSLPPSEVSPPWICMISRAFSTSPRVLWSSAISRHSLRAEALSPAPSSAETSVSRSARSSGYFGSAAFSSFTASACAPVWIFAQASASSASRLSGNARRICSATRSTRSTPVCRRTSSSSEVYSRRASSSIFSRTNRSARFSRFAMLEGSSEATRRSRSNASRFSSFFWQILKASWNSRSASEARPMRWKHSPRCVRASSDSSSVRRICL